MPVKHWPEILLPCKHGHGSPTTAGPSQKVDCKVCKSGACPTCGPEGKRIALWVPANRPTSARAAAAYSPPSVALAATLAPPGGGGGQGDAPAPGAELGARWDREAGWTGPPGLGPGRPADTCPDCDQVLWWEPGRTVVYCPACQAVTLPPAVARHYDRQASRSTEVAVREQADPLAEAAANARLRALRERAEEWLDGWLETLADPNSYDRTEWQRQAAELGAVLRGWRPEISKAESEEKLTAIKSHIVAEILNSDAGAALRDEHGKARQRIAAAIENGQRAAEQEQRQREQEAQEARDRQEAERARAREIAARPPLAITSGAPSTGWAAVNDMIVRQKQRTARAIEQRGACAFKHTLGDAPAERLYAVPDRDYLGNPTGYAVAGTPQIRACSKHFPAAEAELNRQGYPDLNWWSTHADS